MYFQLISFANRLLVCVALLAMPVLLHAQNIEGEVRGTDDEPLIGANVYWLGTTSGTSTDLEGRFSIPAPTGNSSALVVTYVGYISDTISVEGIDPLLIKLQSNQSLETVVVTEQQQGSFISTINPIKTEVLTQKELSFSACCDLAGCFNTQASVQATTTNIVTNAKELRILGLSGVYNQVLIEGFPLIQGLSYTYGISAVPGTLVDNIYVAKGANSVLQGYESIAGQINVILKSPDKEDKVFLNAYGNSFGEKQLNANYTHRWNRWSTILAAHTTQAAKKTDADKDTFLDLPLLTRYSFFNKWQYRDANEWGWHSTIGLRYIDEERIGGQTTFDSEDEGTTRAYGQTVRFSQPEFYTKTGYRLDDYHHIVAMLSGFHQQQTSYYGTTHYDARNTNLYANLQYEHTWQETHSLKTGFSFRFQDLDEDIAFGADSLNRTYAGAYQREEYIPGFFAENTFNWLENRLTLITGFRFDKHNDLGWFATPRALLKANLSALTTARVSVGKGWRTVNLFAENVNLLASSRDVIITEPLEAEEAINYGLNLTHRQEGDQVEAQFSFDFYRTTFQNQIFPDYDSEATKAYIRNFRGTSISNGLQAELGLAFYRRLGLKLAYNYLDVYRMEEGEKQQLPFNPKHRVSASFSFEPLTKTYQVSANLHWMGEQRLANTAGNPPEFRQADFSDPYAVVNAQFTKVWPTLEVYFGCENIFDFRQFQPIQSWENPFGPYFDTANVWGPTRGREFYLGVRYRIE